MTDRLLWIDAVRALAAQTIVLHHLSIYGPVARSLAQAAPGVMGWLDEYGRIAVQVFLVLGGALSARALARARALHARSVMRLLCARYLRLFVPFYGALVLVVLASAAGRLWLDENWIAPMPDALTVLAHLTGLYDYLGIEALSAGAWYVTIDWQLHAVVILMAWACMQAPVSVRQALWPAAVAGLAALSLLWINRHAAWDVQPLYFFGSFALGMAAAWLAESRQTGERLGALAILACAVLGLILAWRLRIAVALVTAIVVCLGLSGWGAWVDRMLRDPDRPFAGLLRRVIQFLGDTAYSLFLVHFAMCILVNAWFVRLSPGNASAAASAFLAAWALSLGLAWALYRVVEVPLARRRLRDVG